MDIPNIFKNSSHQHSILGYGSFWQCIGAIEGWKVTMRVLIKNMNFSGGAPRSMVEFVKSIHNNNNEVLVLGQYVKEPTYYSEAGIETINIESFKRSRPIKNIVNVIKLYKVITTFCPDVIVATGSECYTLKILDGIINVPVVYMWQGGIIHDALPKFLKDENIIVFSKENIDQMTKYGYEKKNIYLITNRISVIKGRKCNRVSLKKANDRDQNVVKCAMITGMTRNKIGSIRCVLNKIKDLGFTKLSLDIIGDGELMSEVKAISDEVNDQFGKQIINIKGYVSEVSSIIEGYDVFFGKGRSVIEPMLYRKIGIVVSEDNRMCICDNDSFENLYYYNFSGRNLSNTTPDKSLIELFESVLYDELETDKYNQAFKFIDENYNSKYLEKKFVDVLEITMGNFKNQKKQIRLLGSIARYIYLYLLFFKEVLLNFNRQRT